MGLRTLRWRARRRRHDHGAWAAYATQAVADGATDEALLAARRAGELALDAHDRCRAARLLEATGAVDEAEHLYRQAIADAPDDPDGHELLGALLVRAGRASEGAEALCTAVRLRPNLAGGHLMLADAFVAGRPWPDRAARGRWLDLCHYLVLHGSPPRSPAWDLVQHALETSKRERRT